MAQTEKNKKASLQQVTILRQQIDNREELITALNNEIFQLEQEQDLNEQMIQQLQKKLGYMKADYAQVVYLAYRNRRLMDKVTFILASDDFAQMFRRIRFYTVFAKNVRHQADQINETKAELEKKNEEIVSLKDEKLSLLTGKEQEVKQLEVDRRQKTQDAEKLKKQSKQLSADLRVKQQKRREIDAAIKRAIEKEIAASNANRSSSNNKKNRSNTSSNQSNSSSSSSGASTSSTTRNNATIIMTPEEQSLNSSFVNNKGSLPWPVAKGAKVSDFGNYAHPDVPSVQIENRGIDIMVESGTPARSVFQGVVTGVMDIMGTKVVMVRHGEYLTVYQNLGSVYVKKGDKVSTKQSLGSIAKSATSNTYELHFEIWKNSTYLNPNDWLSRR